MTLRALRLAVAVTVAAFVMPVTGAIAAPSDPSDRSVPVSQVRGNEWWLSKLGIEQAWAKTRGAGVTVAVLDSGVAPHRDLQDAVLPGADFSGKGASNGQAAVGGDPHGTAMAGLIAARGHGAGSAEGLIGVAPAAKILPVSTLIGESSTAVTGAAGGDRGLRWAVDHGAKVVNMSFGGDGGDAVSKTAIAYAQSKDVVLVGAAGNSTLTSSVELPGGYLGVVAVSGIDADLASEPMSNSGGPVFLEPNDLAGDNSGGVAVAGPFGDRRVTSNQDLVTSLDITGSGYRREGGTSAATAVVSGIVALIRAAHPELNAANVISRLVQTARIQNPARQGYSTDQGFGVPNAYRAITADVPAVCENPLGSLAEPASFGIWKSIKNSTRYAPTCSTASSSPAGSSSAPSGGSSSAVAGPASDSDSGIPVWVWPVAVLVVLAVIGGLLLARRRPAPAQHGPPPGQGYGPPQQ